jgi:hypothetical protein
VTPQRQRRVTVNVAWTGSLVCEPVQAALTVLGRRPRDRVEPFPLQLHRTDLRGAMLAEAHLEGAYLPQARLEGAILIGTCLEGADLAYVHLWGANLANAHLEDARSLTVGQLLAARPWQNTRLPAALAADAAVRARIAEVDRKRRDLLVGMEEAPNLSGQRAGGDGCR